MLMTTSTNLLLQNQQETLKIQRGGGTQADLKQANDSSSKTANDINKKEEDKANAQAPQALTAEPKKQAPAQTEEKKRSYCFK